MGQVGEAVDEFNKPWTFIQEPVVCFTYVCKAKPSLNLTTCFCSLNGTMSILHSSVG